MDTYTIFALVVLVLGAFQYYLYFWSRPARETSRFLPGPKTWPIFGAVLSIGRNPVDFYKSIFDWVEEHGYVYRGWVGPYLFVLVADPVFMEAFLNSTVNIKKSMNYEFLQPWLGTGLLTSFGSKWKSRRKIITPAFHFKILDGFMESFNSNANILISKWKNEVSGSEFDIFNHLTLYTLDVICDAAMGVQLNAQNNPNCEYITALHELADTIVSRSISPWYFPEFIFNMSPIGRKQKELIKKLHSMSYKVIEQRKKDRFHGKKKDNPDTENQNDIGQKKRLAFLDMLLQYNEDGGNLTLEDIREEVDTLMFEGHDTTSSGLSFCLWSLAEHPDSQQKVYEELLEIFGDSNRDTTSEDLGKMKYLECVIKESLRLFPSVPLFLRELNEDVKIEGINIVAGTTVALAPAIMHKNPKYFPNPEKFDPERFTAENARGRHPYAYVPFSAGSRNCIGQKFAMMEIKVLISKVLRHFKLIGVGRKPTYSYEMILRTTEGLYIKLENRK